MEYYKLKTGKFINRTDIEFAYEILEGGSPYDGPKSRDRFIAFLDYLMHKTIEYRLEKPSDGDVRQIAMARQPVKASQLYRDLHHCTISEAYLHVMDMIVEPEGLGGES